ncbi:MAG: hypothetical protein A3I77_00490 [Gammaproteobacteria bacterium RIFCSPLOWO2_02_FULL_42_14]|nr:MAG: hypothetical protein A3B71_08575 [Gammaproteobacteria bacterium RIFCSPHIGHO2_02_FULL_42_43]OGT29295.1 MAG: hypothetical protein A2624_04660 [Gammaproteobacteria bacterium RIFCSPHIGHO2_01_FULL_42_8]OGT50764.1 MAG: hypothetical protein A3E54_00770 [Gammaproteobacteria bacterium RIFCSPHIGHO2_12_FULL_41_25]OGT61749.1 MAG: hypothetical protein A3I77_00490 [Gammaproteobacteria bacterium RIFCSPLOWO2_02_FULL_42_14]OGT85493.1 MAG: hypothetical protein A3G86_06680 [Gammaproteobacteria bacterium R
MQVIPIFHEEGIEFDRLLGNGAFNDVYLSKTSLYVFKQPKVKSPLTPNSAIPSTDIPENAVLVWNSINGEKLGNARVANKPYYGWLSPYVAGKTPSSKEVSSEIINIYANTKRIVYDAHQLKNFIKRESDKKIFCIDLGLAILPATIKILDTSTNGSVDTSVEKNIEKCLCTHVVRLQSSGKATNYKNEEPSVTVLALEYLAENYPLLTTKEIEKLDNNEALLHALADAYLVQRSGIQPSGNQEYEYLSNLGIIYYHFHSPIFSVNPHEDIFHPPHSDAASVKFRMLKGNLMVALKNYMQKNNSRWIHNKKLSSAKNALTIQLTSAIHNASNKANIIESIKITIEKNRKVSAYFSNQTEQSAKLGEFDIVLQKMLTELTKTEEQKSEGETRGM